MDSVEIEFNPKLKSVPKWKRTAIYSDGVVFLPACYVGPENLVSFAAMGDGVPVFPNRRHVYVPSTWAETERPTMAEFFRDLARRVADAACRFKDANG